MILRLLGLALLLLVASCSSVKPKAYSDALDGKIHDLQAILDRSEEEASPSGKVVLMTSRAMIAKREVVVGSCWDYINAVYNRAQYPADKRVTALKSKIVGPFADISIIQPGDWLYFINHSYSEVDHSGVFVEWVDRDKKSAVMMSYVGGKRKSNATYKIYNLKNVYYIIRPKD